MSKQVRVGVIGSGWWGCEAHLPALRDHPRAAIVAVQSRSKEKARKIADDFGAAHACTSAQAMMAIEELDAVIISSTPNMHYEQAKAALQRGLHVLIEKPMTFTAAQAKELVDIAQRKRLAFLVSCPWHYTPHNVEARRLIRTGQIGEVKMVSILMTNFTEGLYQSKTWDEIFGNSSTLQNVATPYREPGLHSYSDPRVAGGGQIYCQVSHAAAHLGFLVGGEPAEVFARFDHMGTPVDVYDVLNMKLSNGALVSMASTGATMQTERNYEVRVFGTQGMIHLELWKGQMAHYGRDGSISRQPNLDDGAIYPMFEPAKNLVDVVAEGAVNGSPAELGLYAMQVIEAACRSAETKQNICVESLK
jgi:predicted dehydrogenase